MQKLCTKLGAGEGAGYIYDLQILPYMPAINARPTNSNSGTWIYSYGTAGQDYSYITATTNTGGEETTVNYGIVYYARSANNSLDIPMDLPAEKVEYETEKTYTQPLFILSMDNAGYDDIPYGHDEDGYPIYYFTTTYGVLNYKELNNTG